MLIAPQNSRSAVDLGANLQLVRNHIAAAAVAARRSVDSVTLVAVSKAHPAAAVRAAAALGVVNFGESYPQEALPKLAALRDLPVTWHFIGRIQANKTRSIAEQFDWVHGVERMKIAERLSAQRPHYAPPLNVCIQVNIAADPGKAGVGPAEARELIHAGRELPALRLRGLMCMLPADGAPGSQRQSFAALRHLLEDLNRRGTRPDEGAGQVEEFAPLDTLSMGMSADYEAAILEGATLVRVGMAIFGPRAGA